MKTFRSAFSYIKTLPRTFWIVILATLINQMGNMAFVFLIVYLTEALHFSVTEASTAFAFFSASMMLSGLVGGSLADRIGPARLMIAVLMVNSVVLLLFPCVKSPAEVMLFCMLWGGVYGLYRPASQTLISHLSSPGMNKITFSVYRLVINLGMSIGPAIGGYLAGISFKSIFFANGIANLCAGIFLLIGLLGTTWLSYQPARKHRFEIGFKYLVKDKSLQLFALAMVPVCMVFFQHESTLPVFLNEQLDLPLTFYGSLFTINTLLIVFFELPLNIATMQWPYRINFMLGSFLIAAGFAGLYFAVTELHVVLLTMVWTFGEMILFPAASSYIADIAPAENRGSYMSIYSTCSNLGMLFGPVLGAYIMQYDGSLDLWMMCGVLGMFSVALFAFVGKKEIKEEEIELAEEQAM